MKALCNHCMASNVECILDELDATICGECKAK